MKQLLILALVASNACWGQNNLTSGKLDLNGSMTVHIKSVTQPEKVSANLATYHTFPRNDVTIVRDSLMGDRKEIYLTTPFRTLGRATLYLADSSYQLVAAPGDTIIIDVLTKRDDEKGRPFISFAGKNKQIQQYYQAKRSRSKEPIQAGMNAGMTATSLAPFKQFVDQDYQTQLRFLDNFQNTHQLPAWFVAYEKKVINYDDAWLREYIAWYQVKVQKKTQEIPESYYDHRKRTEFGDTTDQFQYEYVRFLYQYIINQTLQARDVASVENLAVTATKELGESLDTWLKIWIVSKQGDNPEQAESRFKKPNGTYQYLVDYLKVRAEENILTLKPGSKAPNFALVDSRDTLVTLSDFKGQVVYISFWFSTCGGCIKEIPFENKLVEKFKGKPVKIISICNSVTPSVPDSKQLQAWQTASKKYGLKTVDLYANKSWTQTLTEKYMLKGYPHYVLIGADGNIIQNFADWPSQNVASKIEKALADAGN